MASSVDYPSFAERFWRLARPEGGVDLRTRAAALAVAHVASIWSTRRQGVQLDDPAYAAPEAQRGEPLDERSLVFTLALLLFERLTGAHPFGGDLRTRIERLRAGQMSARVGSLFVRLPRGLRPVLARALAAQPDDRFPSLQAFADTLTAATEGSGFTPPPARDEADRTELINNAEQRARELHEATLARERRGRGFWRRLVG